VSEDLVRYISRLEKQVSTLQQVVAEHRHFRDPQWDEWTRLVNHYGRTEWDDHFRSGVIPAGYAWQGAPFGGAPGGAGGTLDYSFHGTYLRVICDVSPHFLATGVVAYADKWFVARCDTGNGTQVGIRADDGTNNNYAEIYLNPQNNNTVQVTFAFRAGGGAITTNASPSVRSDIPHVMMLVYNSGLPGFFGYTARESGRYDAQNNHTTGAIAWVPSRIGLLFRNNMGFSACVDFIYNEYD
jgi:hypothetical protein